jgi:hypothetical protein
MFVSAPLEIVRVVFKVVTINESGGGLLQRLVRRSVCARSVPAELERWPPALQVGRPQQPAVQDGDVAYRARFNGRADPGDWTARRNRAD